MSVRASANAAVAEVFGKEWARGARGRDLRPAGVGDKRTAAGIDEGFGGMATKPGFVVGVQSLAIGKTQECGAIVDLGRQPGLVQLCLRDGGEPAAEGLTVLGGVQPQKIGGFHPQSYRWGRRGRLQAHVGCCDAKGDEVRPGRE